MSNHDLPPWEVALTKCYFCSGDGAIVMPKVMTHKACKEVKAMHGKIVDMTPCQKCKEYMEQGVILIGILPDKCTPGWEKDKLPNPYRSGGWSVIKDEAVEKLFPKEMAAWALKHRFILVDHAAGEQIGAWGDTEQTKTTGDQNVEG